MANGMAMLSTLFSSPPSHSVSHPISAAASSSSSAPPSSFSPLSTLPPSTSAPLGAAGRLTLDMSWDVVQQDEDKFERAVIDDLFAATNVKEERIDIRAIEDGSMNQTDSSAGTWNFVSRVILFLTVFPDPSAISNITVTPTPVTPAEFITSITSQIPDDSSILRSGKWTKYAVDANFSLVPLQHCWDGSWDFTCPPEPMAQDQGMMLLGFPLYIAIPMLLAALLVLVGLTYITYQLVLFIRTSSQDLEVPELSREQIRDILRAKRMKQLQKSGQLKKGQHGKGTHEAAGRNSPLMFDVDIALGGLIELEKIKAGGDGGGDGGDSSHEAGSSSSKAVTPKKPRYAEIEPQFEPPIYIPPHLKRLSALITSRTAGHEAPDAYLDRELAGGNWKDARSELAAYDAYEDGMYCSHLMEETEQHPMSSTATSRPTISVSSAAMSGASGMGMSGMGGGHQPFSPSHVSSRRRGGLDMEQIMLEEDEAFQIQFGRRPNTQPIGVAQQQHQQQQQMQQQMQHIQETQQQQQQLQPPTQPQQPQPRQPRLASRRVKSHQQYRQQPQQHQHLHAPQPQQGPHLRHSLPATIPVRSSYARPHASNNNNMSLAPLASGVAAAAAVSGAQPPSSLSPSGPFGLGPVRTGGKFGAPPTAATSSSSSGQRIRAPPTRMHHSMQHGGAYY